MSSEPGASDYSGLPGIHVSVDQIVAMNIRHWRRKAGLTQKELADLVGWTAPNVSAAELSAKDGKDKRRFDAQTLITFAGALDLPLAALFMPPEDDGISRRYLYDSADDCKQMGELAALAVSEPSEEDTPAMNAYRARYVEVLNTYFDSRRGQYLAGAMEALSSTEARKLRLERLAWQREALAAMVGDIDKIVDAIVDTGSES